MRVLRAGSPSLHALNDVVVARGERCRLISVKTRVDGDPIATHRCDAVIVATATGSTGYSLAAGGPILHPQSQEFILLPILPHLCSAYPMVLPQAAVVKLNITTAHQAILSIDGHIHLALSNGATMTIKHSANTTRFLRIHPENSFYGTLEQRLKGKR